MFFHHKNPDQASNMFVMTVNLQRFSNVKFSPHSVSLTRVLGTHYLCFGYPFRHYYFSRHVEHYIKKCSYGDWFVLYQMSRNMNRRFFAEFLTLLSRRVNPDPNVDDDEENEDILKRMQKPIRGTNSTMDLTGKPGKFGKKNLSSITLHSKVFDLTFNQ